VCFALAPWLSANPQATSKWSSDAKQQQHWHCLGDRVWRETHGDDTHQIQHWNKATSNLKGWSSYSIHEFNIFWHVEHVHENRHLKSHCISTVWIMHQQTKLCELFVGNPSETTLHQWYMYLLCISSMLKIDEVCMMISSVLYSRIVLCSNRSERRQAYLSLLGIISIAPESVPVQPRLHLSHEAICKHKSLKGSWDSCNPLDHFCSSGY
jgi:hypothetical protein